MVRNLHDCQSLGFRWVLCGKNQNNLPMWWFVKSWSLLSSCSTKAPNIEGSHTGTMILTTFNVASLVMTWLAVSRA